MSTQEEMTGNIQAVAPLGEVLLAARKAKKLTLQDASDNLRYSVRQIEALENDDFSALPEPMITRGFIRNYARYLALDAEPLLASYRERVPDVSHSEVSVKSAVGEVSLTEDNQPWLKYILSSIVVLLFLLAWFFYVDYQPTDVESPQENVTTPALGTNELAPTTEAVLPEAALPVAERQAMEETVDAAGNPASVATPTDTPANVAAPQLPNTSLSMEPKKEALPLPSNNQAPASQAVSHQAASTAKGTAVKKQFSISVEDKTWVSVTDAAGKVIFEKMLSAGNVEAFDAAPPLNVVIGNAKASKLTYAGQSVDLTTSEGSNVARLRLE